MKLISYHLGDYQLKTGVVLGEQVLDISQWICELVLAHETSEHHAACGQTAAASGMLRWLQSGPGRVEKLKIHLEQASNDPDSRYQAMSGISLYAPLPRPGKIIGVGRNYADHAKETGVAPFEKPRIIFMVPSSVTGPGSEVKRPQAVSKMDFEAELAVVMGGYAHQVSESEALKLVAGYTVLNDLSAREFQFDIAPPQTTFAKSMDGFTPMGPWLVTADEILDPQTLSVCSWLNGTQMQHGHTADMLFPVAKLIAYISEYMTLEPGDVIATGTPAGIGAFRQPPVYLQAGDHLRFEISQVGVLEHTIA